MPLNARSSAAPPRLAAFALATLSLTALLASCAEANPESHGAAITDPAAGGRVVVAIESDQGCVDPQQVSSSNSVIWTRQTVDSLTDQDPDSGEIVPWLAETWEVNDDATSFTFNLTEDATFSDGSPVDADAVKANFDALADLGGRAVLASGYIAGYKGAEVLDPRTVRIDFDVPNAQFLQATSTVSLGLVSAETAASTPDERCGNVIGSGPFVLDEFEPNSKIVLTGRDDYAWGSSLAQHDGAAYLDTLEFQIVPESSVRTGSLQSGAVDVVIGIGPQDEGQLQGSDIDLLGRPSPGVPMSLAFNQTHELFADHAVRAAISGAIDRQDIVDTAMTSFNAVATSVLADTTPYAIDLSQYLGFSPDESSRLLDGAGWRKGSDGVWAKEGDRLSFDIVWVPTDSATSKAAVELLQQQLASAGIEVQLRETPVENIVNVILKGDYDVLWGGTSRSDPDILRTLYSAKLANFYQFPDGSGLQDLLDAQAAEPDTARRAEIVAEAQEAIVSEYKVIPIALQAMVIAVAPRVQDIRFEASSRLQFFDTWVNG